MRHFDNQKRSEFPGTTSPRPDTPPSQSLLSPERPRFWCKGNGGNGRMMGVPDKGDQGDARGWLRCGLMTGNDTRRATFPLSPKPGVLLVAPGDENKINSPGKQGEKEKVGGGKGCNTPSPGKATPFSGNFGGPPRGPGRRRPLLRGR